MKPLNFTARYARNASRPPPPVDDGFMGHNTVVSLETAMRATAGLRYWKDPKGHQEWGPPAAHHYSEIGELYQQTGAIPTAVRNGKPLGCSQCGNVEAVVDPCEFCREWWETV